MYVQYTPLLLVLPYWLGVVVTDYYLENVFIPKSAWVAARWNSPDHARLDLHIWSVLWPVFLLFMWYKLDRYGWVATIAEEQRS